MSLARALLAAGLVTATSAPVAQAGPPERSMSRFRGLEGYATFSLFVDACTYGYVDVYAIEEMTQDGPGAPAPTAYTAVFYNTYDWCSGQYMNGFGWDPNALIRGSAVQSLVTRATVPMTVCSSSWPDPPTCVSRTLLVDLEWTANGGTATHGQETRHSSSLSFTVHSHSVGMMTTADVSGTLLMDDEDLLANVAWGAGGLSRVQEGSIEFIRY